MAGPLGMSGADFKHSRWGAPGMLLLLVLFLYVVPTSQTSFSSTYVYAKACAGGPHGTETVMRLRGGKTGGIKARDMWGKPVEELSHMEEELRLELMSLRVAKQVGGQPGRVNQIKNVRKSIARVLTVITAKRRAEAYELVQKDKYKPLDARKNRCASACSAPMVLSPWSLP